MCGLGDGGYGHTLERTQTSTVMFQTLEEVAGQGSWPPSVTAILSHLNEDKEGRWAWPSVEWRSHGITQQAFLRAQAGTHTSVLQVLTCLIFSTALRGFRGRETAWQKVHITHPSVPGSVDQRQDVNSRRRVLDPHFCTCGSFKAPAIHPGQIQCPSKWRDR